MKYGQLLLRFGRETLRKISFSSDDSKKPRRQTHLQADPLLEVLANELLVAAGCSRIYVKVFWNPALRTTAGLASWRDRQILLNPKLIEISAAEVQRTLRHELAHFLAQYRVGRLKIADHGQEWKLACADLGIPNESRCHTLPFQRRKILPKFFYRCPGCTTVLARVRPLRRKVACIKCCQKFHNGAYHEQFRFQRMEAPPVDLDRLSA